MPVISSAVSESGKVGNLGEVLAFLALKELEKEGKIKNLKRQVPTHEEDKIGLYFKTDIEFERCIDNQKIIVWVTQRTSAENSDSYFWGLLNQLSQVWRKYKKENPICILLIFGSEKYWKSWVFGAATLVFDYVFFLGETGANINRIQSFKLINAPKLRKEIEDSSRFIFESAINTHTLLKKYSSPENAIASSEGKKFIARIKALFDVNSFTPNPYLTDLKEKITNFIEDHIQNLDNVDNLLETKISEEYHDDIEFLSLFLICLLLREVRKDEQLIKAVSYIYQTPKEKIIEKIEKLAEYGFLIYNKDKIPNIKVNPCFLASLVTYFSKLQGSELSVTQLYYYFVYSLLFTSALSESQMQLLKELSKYQEIKDPVALIEFLKRERSSPQKLKNYNYRVLEALAKILENKSSILKRRSILLDQYLAECLKINCIKQKNGLIELNNQIMKRLNTDEIVYYFNLSVKSDRYDSYVLYLLDTYRIRRVATEFRKLRDITPIDNDKKRKLLEQYLFEKNDDDIHLFAEVALYAYNIPANEMLNRVEGFRAGTRFYAFLRGSEELSSEQRKRFLEEMTKEMQKEPLKDIKTISNDILSRRREQIRRNVTVNPLEERIQQKLIEKRIIFFGGTSKQADVYLMSFLNEIGLKVIDAPEARGEDFVIPLKSGGVVAIVCRASPISFEAQRMMGHSLQFVLGWDSNREEFYLKPHLHHIAIVGGGRWDKKWVSILYSLFDRVYSGNEIDCMMDYLISLEPITFDNWPNSDYNTVLEKLRKRITGKIIDVRDLPKIIEDLKKEDLKKQAKIADFL